MGSIFDNVQSAKSAFGRDFAKEGRYFVVVDRATYGKHTVKTTEFIAFETRVAHVIDCPKDQRGNPTVKPGEPCSFVFMSGVLGNEARLKAFILVAAGDPGAPAKEDDITADDVKKLVDPQLQPVKGVILEIFAQPQPTRSGKTITASRATRQVSHAELLSVIDPKAKADLFPGDTLEKLAAASASA